MFLRNPSLMVGNIRGRIPLDGRRWLAEVFQQIGLQSNSLVLFPRDTHLDAHLTRRGIYRCQNGQNDGVDSRVGG
jgi:hypothetical protein